MNQYNLIIIVCIGSIVSTNCAEGLCYRQSTSDFRQAFRECETEECKARVERQYTVDDERCEKEAIEAERE